MIAQRSYCLGLFLSILASGLTGCVCCGPDIVKIPRLDAQLGETRTNQFTWRYERFGPVEIAKETYQYRVNDLRILLDKDGKPFICWVDRSDGERSYGYVRPPGTCFFATVDPPSVSKMGEEWRTGRRGQVWT